MCGVWVCGVGGWCVGDLFPYPENINFPSFPRPAAARKLADEGITTLDGISIYIYLLMATLEDTL